MTQRKANAKSGYLAEIINFGGEPMSRARAISEMEKGGAKREEIDRWLQGNDLARKIQARKAAMKNPAELVIFGNPRRKNTTPKASSGGKRRRGSLAGRRRRVSKKNPEELDRAVELYEQFHGKDAQSVVEKQRSAAMRTAYTALGPLLAVGLFTPGLAVPSPDHWEEYPHLKFEKDVILASNAEGTQLYAIGGNQDCSGCLQDLPDVDTAKDLLDLGALAFVVYLARKAPTFEPVEWMHDFEKPLPSLGYDQVKREIFFVGGAYTVEAPGIIH